MEAADKVVWYQREHFVDSNGQVKPDFGSQGLHITTSCAGPPSDDKAPGGDEEEQREARQKAKPLLKDFDARQDNTYNVGNVTTHYKQGERVLRPAGGRLLTFDRETGRITRIDEISAKTAKWGDS